MFQTAVFFWLFTIVSSSHYRGGSISWSIREVDYKSVDSTVGIRISQRHSWRRSAASDMWNVPLCEVDTINNGSAIIGENSLNCVSDKCSRLGSFNSRISAVVPCTDFSIEYDYASGESYLMIQLPVGYQFIYSFSSCCWIPLLPGAGSGSWTLIVMINTIRRTNGKFNNAPVSTMNPTVQLRVGQVHVIYIPMADSDGDTVRCRWGLSENETGSIYHPKGYLQSNPCKLTYNATKIGYEGVALIIEDFDAHDTVLSSIPLQFLIRIVDAPIHSNESTIAPWLPQPCSVPPIYVGDWQRDACIGINSNSTTELRIVVKIPCQNTSTSIEDILTISPQGMIKSNITRDLMDNNTYIMYLQWQPEPHQYGIHQVCVTPADSERQIGSSTCFNLQVDVKPPTFIRSSMVPTGIVTPYQNVWNIFTDVDIVRPTHGNIYARFMQRDPFNSNRDTEIVRVNSANIHYDRRKVTIYTYGTIWEPGQDYYIILDGGLVEINETCGVQSEPIIDSNFWTFTVEMEYSTETTEITNSESSIRTSSTVLKSSFFEEVTSRTTATTSTEVIIPISSSITPNQQTSATTTMTSTVTTSTTQNITCPQWLQFGTIMNVVTNDSHPDFTFCFHVNESFTDVTVGANTWIPCARWKVSGAADPFIDLYAIGNNVKMLAQNDDGNSIPHLNCYAAVLSYRLAEGYYRVVIHHQKCLYGYFEVRLSAETTYALK